MKPVFKYINEFYLKEFNLFYLLLIITLLGVLIYLNYWHGLESVYIAGDKSRLAKFTGFYLLYLIPFTTAFLLQLLFFKDVAYFRNRWFWIILFLSPALFSFRVIFNFHTGWIKDHWTGSDKILYLQCINWIVRVMVLLIPVFIIWYLKDSNSQPFYGAKPLVNSKPYILMLLVMIPLIALASTQADFLHVYPKAQVLNNVAMNSAAGKWRYLLFELCYGFDFISIEFFFRGFLILALANICGRHCIIPVACFYCTIHFGKPMGEAISSFFGGILLGIISYNTGSIWGGLLVHLGIAWIMEAGGWLGHLFTRTK